MGRMTHIKYIGLLIIILLTQFYCRREFDNPVDTDVILEEVKSLVAEQEGEWIRLSWLKQDRITGGYDIERKDSEKSFQHLALIEDLNITTYLDTSISTDQSYVYRIRGFSDENFTPYTDEIIFQVDFPAPYGLEYQIDSDSSISISWQDSASFENAFMIERSSSIDTTWQLIGQTETDSTEYADSGLSYNIEYIYRIRALTTNNRSDYSETLVTKILMNAPQLQNVIPLNDHQMQVEWTEDITFERGFLVERRQNSNMEWREVGRVNENVTIFVDDSLKVQNSYFYRIRAFTDKNFSNYSNQLSGQTFFPAPSNLSINSWTSTSLVLSWDDLEFEEGYYLRYVTKGQMDTITHTLSQNATSYQITNLDTIFIYLIDIQGFTAYNRSARSHAELNFTQQASLQDSFNAHEYSVLSLAFSNDGQILASGGAEGDVHICTVEQWANIISIAGDTIQESVKNITFLLSDAYLLVGYDYSYLKLFELPSWSFYQDINPITYQLNDISHSESTGKLAVAKYRFIYIWSTSSWSLEKTFTASNHDVYDLAYDSDGQWLASTDEETGVKIWETTNWAEIQALDEHTEGVRVLSTSANGKWLASGSLDNTIIIWDTDNWTSINKLTEHRNDVVLLCFTRDNSWLASVEKTDYRILIWSTEDWEIEQTLQLTSPTEITSIAFSPDGKYLLVGEANGKIWIWQFAGSWVLS